MQSLRRGLVLEGGGAKGAFQFGVLRALRENQVTFDAVSGTSVGALNGFLWSSGNLGLGEDLWTSLQRRKVFSVRVTAFLFPLSAALWLFDQYAGVVPWSISPTD
jgi:predicted acylesterase/phospholipase RssA